jgi:hypothetical protein
MCDIIKQLDVSDVSELVRLLSIGLEHEYNKETSILQCNIKQLEETEAIYKSHRDLL